MSPLGPERTSLVRRVGAPALFGMCLMHDQPGWQSTVLRLLDVFVDGLQVRDARKANARPRAAAARKPAARKKTR
jgi:hypothetical protein